MMTHAIFEKLINSFCTLSKLKDVNSVLKGGWVIAHESAFSFNYGENSSGPFIAVYADFGPIPPKKETDIYRILLETNLFLHIDQGPVFSVSGKEKHVIFAQRYLLKEMDAEKLRDALATLGNVGREWRKDYFLDGKVNTTSKNRGSFFPGLKNPPQK